jgi:ADP-ribosylglycohydrolase
MALALARSIVAEGRFETAAVRAAYREWAASEPPEGDAVEATLARAAVLGILAHAKPDGRAAELARADAAITGADTATAEAAAVFASAIAQAVESGEALAPSAGAVAAGALFGATRGRAALPAQWRHMVLSCRPHPLRMRRPRPRAYWPIDVLEIAERLALADTPAGRDR